MQKTRLLEMERYHRFIVFGNRNNEEIFAMFTSSSVETHHLLRFQSNTNPGTLVKLLNPKMEGLLKATNTTTLSTIEPLIPVDNQGCRQLKLPHAVETAVFKYFEFRSTTITILSATATESLCPGKLRDGQTLQENCGCTAAASKRIWALTINFRCEELEPIEYLDFGTITSHATTDIFINMNKRDMSPNATDFDTFALDTAVVKLCESINLNKGFEVKSWYKPSIGEEGAAQGLKKSHFCHLQPVNELNIFQSPSLPPFS